MESSDNETDQASVSDVGKLFIVTVELPTNTIVKNFRIQNPENTTVKKLIYTIANKLKRNSIFLIDNSIFNEVGLQNQFSTYTPKIPSFGLFDGNGTMFPFHYVAKDLPERICLKTLRDNNSDDNAQESGSNISDSNNNNSNSSNSSNSSATNSNSRLTQRSGRGPSPGQSLIDSANPSLLVNRVVHSTSHPPPVDPALLSTIRENSRSPPPLRPKPNNRESSSSSSTSSLFPTVPAMTTTNPAALSSSAGVDRILKVEIPELNITKIVKMKTTQNLGNLVLNLIKRYPYLLQLPVDDFSFFLNDTRLDREETIGSIQSNDQSSNIILKFKLSQIRIPIVIELGTNLEILLTEDPTVTVKQLKQHLMKVLSRRQTSVMENFSYADLTDSDPDLIEQVRNIESKQSEWILFLPNRNVKTGKAIESGVVLDESDESERTLASYRLKNGVDFLILRQRKDVLELKKKEDIIGERILTNKDEGNNTSGLISSPVMVEVLEMDDKGEKKGKRIIKLNRTDSVQNMLKRCSVVPSPGGAAGAEGKKDKGVVVLINGVEMDLNKTLGDYTNSLQNSTLAKIEVRQKSPTLPSSSKNINIGNNSNNVHEFGGLGPDTDFGEDLGIHKVPLQLIKIREYITKYNGEKKEGVFRIAGDEVRIRNIKVHFASHVFNHFPEEKQTNRKSGISKIKKPKDKNKLSNTTSNATPTSGLKEETCKCKINEFDVHNLITLLKRWLGRLQNGLFGSVGKLNWKVISATGLTPQDAVIMLLSKLPEKERECYLWLIEVLKSVELLKEENKMDIKNLSVCVGPVLAPVWDDDKDNPDLMEGFRLTADSIALLKWCLQYYILGRIDDCSGAF